MANATARVPMATVPWGDDKIERTTQFATATIYYPGQMMALAGTQIAGGTVDHAADTAGLKFDGILAETDRVQVFGGDTAGRPVKIERPWRFAMAIAAAVAGDEGKAVYVVDNQTVGYSSVNAVLVGWVDQVLSSTLVLIRPFWSGVDQVNIAPSALANPRNLIDGGDFTVNPFQRGTSQAADIASTVTYGPDRFAFKGGASSTINWSQVADTTVPGFANSLKWQRKSGNANTAAFNMCQVLETADSIRCQGQKVTLSFWARTGANYSGGNLTVQLESGTGTNDTAANLFTASWAGQAHVINTTQALTSTMTRYSFTGTVPAGCTQLGVIFQWTPAGTAGSDDSIIINGIQLEVGAAETAFEHRDVEFELALCQRYFFQLNEPAAGIQVANGAPTGTNTQGYVFSLPTPMRAAPTVTVTVGSFKVVVDGAAAAAATGLTTGTGHTSTLVSLASTVTLSAAAHSILLQGGGGAGLIAASADF